MPTPSARTLHRMRLWRQLTLPLADRCVVWGNHAASQPDDGTLGGLLLDWCQQDPATAASFPPGLKVERLAGVEGFVDGSVRLTLEVGMDGGDGTGEEGLSDYPVEESAPRVEAYGHFTEALPEDGGDEVVFQLARLVNPSSGRVFWVPGGHGAVADWDAPGTSLWQE